MTQVVVGQILNGIILGSLYGIIALGVTMTFGITGIVNFALGQFMMIGAYVTYTLAERGLPYPVAVVPASVQTLTPREIARYGADSFFIIRQSGRQSVRRSRNRSVRQSVRTKFKTKF